MKAGILSDTHDLLRKEVMSALEGVDVILHAGDISNKAILEKLRKIAPVYAVKGNADKDERQEVPVLLDFFLGEAHICMAHKKKDLPKDISSYDLVLTGHTHRYSEKRQGNAILLNPGSCGPRRLLQPITMAMAEIEGKNIAITRIDIENATRTHIDTSNLYQVIDVVLKETDKGHGIEYIAEKYGIEETLAEQIVRLYVTHPGVTIDGIMTKMGL